MKKLWLACLMLLGMAVVVNAHATEEKVLNVYNWAEYIAPNTLRDFTTSTGIKVNYDTYDSNETLLAKMQAGATGYDVIFPSDYMITIMRKSNLLEPLDYSKLPNFVNIESRFKNLAYDPGNHYSTPYMWGTTGIGVRIDKVRFPVDSWAVLFKPPAALVGQISMLNDMRDVIGAALKFLGYSINSTNPAEIEAAKQLLLKQKAAVKNFNSTNYQMNLDSGEVWIGQAWNGDVSALYWKGNKNMRFVLPKEGGVMYVDNVAIPKSAPHKDNAHKFLNFLMNARTAADISNYTYYATANKAARPFITKALLEDKTVYPPESILKKFEFLQDLGPASKLYEQAWLELKVE